MLTNTIIETDRLLLRQWRISDIAIMADINQDPKVMEFFPAPRSYSETEAFVLANMELCNKGEPYWAIAKAKNYGCHGVQLTTDKKRPDALEFYKQLGFIASHEGLKLFF